MKRVRLTALLVVACLLLAQPLYAQSKKVTLTTLDWEPYIGEKLPGHGYVYEIVAKAFKSMGYQVDIQFYPWTRALALAQSGKADGLFPEYYDDSRKTEFVFSDSFPGGPVGFMARADSRISFPSDPRKDLTATLQGMKQYTYGVVRGYINTKAFDAASFLRKEEADSDDQNIVKLHGKRIQVIFIDKFVAQYILKTQYPQFTKALTFMEPPLEVKPLYIVFSKKAPNYEQKMRDFNAGLGKLKASGALKAIMGKYGF
ncbi:MAG: transporter substrate-binding domain-containing protein [Humidesulfovibrio sp.]|nr:transporter substrate-binding domain-containing protein [Humidesulfovibrio sp.]